MSYAQRKEISGNRTLAIILVAVIQLGLGYAIVTGLAYNVIKKTVQDLKTFNVEEQPPPPEPPPPPPKDMPDVPPPPITPPSIVNIAPPTPPQITTVVSPVIPPVAPAPPAPPPPPPPKKIEPARAKGDVRMLFSDSDYPASAQAAGAQGTAQAQLTIGPDGRVVGCSLVRSTGNGALDAATCNILRRRAKFTPAHDTSGAATTDTYTTPPITWRLAEE
ncbi:MAG TPA: TonB family protein [Sphingomicrobium sp.]